MKYVYLVILDGEPVSVNRTLDGAHNWVVCQNYDSDCYGDGDFDHNVFIDSDYARVYINNPHIYQRGEFGLSIQKFELDD